MPPAPPVTVPTGQQVAWCPPLAADYGAERMGNPGPFINGSAAADLSSASFTMTKSASANPSVSRIWGAQWNGFDTRYVPLGVTVHSIYGVIVASASLDNAVVAAQTLCPAYNLDTLFNVFNFFNPGSASTMTPTIPSPGTTTNLSTHSANYALLANGNLTSAASMSLGARLTCSQNVATLNCTMNVSYVGLAIYYTPLAASRQPLVSVSLGTSKALTYVGGM